MERPLKEILASLRSLEPFPQVALRVIELSSAEDVVPADLIGVIQADPALTARVLKLCNSAYYGFRRTIASLPEAGTALGTNALVNLVLTSCASRYFATPARNTRAEGERLWQHCITNALASRMLAQAAGGIDPERAYTAGLLQNIGQLVLERFQRQARAEIAREVEQGRPMLEAERVVLGLSHPEIGARLATQWGLPEILVDTIRFHHDPHSARIAPELAATGHLAETLSWAVGAGDGLEELPYEVQKAVFELLEVDRELLAMMPDRLEQELARASDMIELAR